MYASTVVVVGTIVAAVNALTSGQITSFNALNRIMGRQTRICSPVSTPSCSLSCGAGFEVCISWPTCYNPGRGDQCCSDGSYCRTGFYCTNAGCCPDGTSLADCGATRTLSVILPPAPSQTSQTSTSTTTAPTTTSAVVSSSATSSTTSSTTTSTTSSSSTTTSSSASTTRAVVIPTTTRASNTTSTTSSPPLQITGAANHVGLGAAQAVVGGIALLIAL